MKYQNLLAQFFFKAEQGKVSSEGGGGEGEAYTLGLLFAHQFDKYTANLTKVVFPKHKLYTMSINVASKCFVVSILCALNAVSKK